MTNDYFLVTNAVLYYFIILVVCSEIAFYNKYAISFYLCVITRKLYKSFVDRKIAGRSKTDYDLFYNYNNRYCSGYSLVPRWRGLNAGG